MPTLTLPPERYWKLRARLGDLQMAQAQLDAQYRQLAAEATAGQDDGLPKGPIGMNDDTLTITWEDMP
jgi:hypothetical protein